jgi:hypothetical protein
MLGRKLAVVLMVLIVGSLAPWSDAEAATVEAMTLDDMAERAETIFVGRVVGTRADWNARRTRIYTYVTLEVKRFLKGGAGESEITVRHWGGEVGAFRAMVPGSPHFIVGEDVLLFCAGTRARVPTVLGLALGKFTLTRDSAGAAILKRDISGLILANYRSDSRPVGTLPTRYRLSEVESRIRAALAR